jgi:hypothetical protein
MDPETQTSGISAREGLWPTVIRILFVIDGRIKLHKDGSDFGLGYVLETLRASSSWWVRFDVEIVTREETISEFALGGNTVVCTSFKFTSDIDEYDQIWFFADQPNTMDRMP